jgi:hypothetical protein
VAIDEAGSVGGEEDEGSDKFIDLARAPRGGAFFQPCRERRIGDQRGIERRVEVSRRNSVELQAVP